MNLRHCYAGIGLITVILTHASLSSAQQFRYGWTISRSISDPFVNTGSPTGGVESFYLWYQCSVGVGMAAADFSLIGSLAAGGNVLSFNTLNNYLNAGTATSPLLVIFGCPTGPVVAGSWLILHATVGDLCLGPGQAYPTPVTVDCSLNPSVHPMDYIGYSDTALGPPCTHFEAGNQLCQTPVSIEATSWGSIKRLYR